MTAIAKPVKTRKKRVPSASGFEEIAITTIETKKPELTAVPKNFNFLANVFDPKKKVVATNVGWEDYPMCCGAAIIFNFYAKTAAEYKKQIAPRILKAENAKKGMLMAIINGDQNNLGAGKALSELGFECVFGASNPNHADATTIYMFIKNLGMKNIDIAPLNKKRATA